MKIRPLIFGLSSYILSSCFASAIILTSNGEVNISIPNTFDGVYLDFTNPENATDYTLSYSDPSPAAWDINLFYGGAAVANSPTFSPVLASPTTNSALVNLAPGATVGPSSNFPSSYSGSTGHMGLGAQQFQTGSIGYLGFVLNPGAENYYGWMRVTLNDDGTAGTIHEWAWDNSGAPIAVGAVPEARNMALLFGFVIAFFTLTRRRARI